MKEMAGLNKEKALVRELTRLRKTQNPSATDFRRMRRLRKARARYWLLLKRRHGRIGEQAKRPEKKGKKKEKKREKAKEPEIEEIDIGEELEEIYSVDEDFEEEEGEELPDEADTDFEGEDMDATPSE